MNGQLAPDAAVAIAVENLLRDGFEQWIRRGEIDELVALIVGYEFSAAPATAKDKDCQLPIADCRFFSGYVHN